MINGKIFVIVNPEGLPVFTDSGRGLQIEAFVHKASAEAIVKKEFFEGYSVKEITYEIK